MGWPSRVVQLKTHSPPTPTRSASSSELRAIALTSWMSVITESLPGPSAGVSALVMDCLLNFEPDVFRARLFDGTALPRRTTSSAFRRRLVELVQALAGLSFRGRRYV